MSVVRPLPRLLPLFHLRFCVAMVQVKPNDAFMQQLREFERRCAAKQKPGSATAAVRGPSAIGPSLPPAPTSATSVQKRPHADSGAGLTRAAEERVCEECERSLAVTRCGECTVWYCQPCCELVHSEPALSTHAASFTPVCLGAEGKLCAASLPPAVGCAPGSEPAPQATSASCTDVLALGGCGVLQEQSLNVVVPPPTEESSCEAPAGVKVATGEPYSDSPVVAESDGSCEEGAHKRRRVTCVHAAVDGGAES